SGSGDDNLNRCAKEGISKVNIYTDLYLAAMASADESKAKDYLSLRAAIKAGIQSCLKHYYSVFETK
ncbi:MAG: class II fructose-bisphosphate aldolase, partial [Candidatus Fimousia sp.]